ncbi:MAG TPA: hypothetical protein PKY29_04470 [Ferruginibacter sp.]|nr:hypothetical protein [Ferruginibacter sp.]HRQ20543.1 hypothetical protein [Ferruginibacter sp.]
MPNLSNSTPSDETLKKIEELAKLFFVPSEIALMLEINKEFFNESLKDEANPIYKAFYTGFLQGEVDLRQCIMKLAISGSSPAQTMANDILTRARFKLNKR